MQSSLLCYMTGFHNVIKFCAITNLYLLSDIILIACVPLFSLVELKYQSKIENDLLQI